MSQPRFVHNLVPLEDTNLITGEVEFAYPPETRCVAEYFDANEKTGAPASVHITPCDSIGRPIGNTSWRLTFVDYYPRVGTVKEQEYYRLCRRKREMEEEADG